MTAVQLQAVKQNIFDKINNCEDAMLLEEISDYVNAQISAKGYKMTKEIIVAFDEASKKAYSEGNYYTNEEVFDELEKEFGWK